MPTIPASTPRAKGRSRGMASFQGDAAAWEAYLAEGNAQQARKRGVSRMYLSARSQPPARGPNYKQIGNLHGGMAEANEPPLEAARARPRRAQPGERPAFCCVWTGLPPGPWNARSFPLRRRVITAERSIDATARRSSRPPVCMKPGAHPPPPPRLAADKHPYKPRTGHVLLSTTGSCRTTQSTLPQGFVALSGSDAERCAGQSRDCG